MVTGGFVYLTSGHSSSTTSGSVIVSTSSSAGSGPSGAVQILTGAASSGDTGAIELRTGAAAWSKWKHCYFGWCCFWWCWRFSITHWRLVIRSNWGTVSIMSGSGTSTSSGSITIATGDGGTSGVSERFLSLQVAQHLEILEW